MSTPSHSPDLKRRSFLAAAFSGALVTPGVMNAAEVEKAIAGKFHEPAQDLPLAEDADVIVCGAGPAGIAAAITAARAGAKVRGRSGMARGSGGEVRKGGRVPLWFIRDMARILTAQAGLLRCFVGYACSVAASEWRT